MDRDYLLRKKAEYQAQLEANKRDFYAIQGAIQAVDEMLAELDAPMSIKELGELVGAQEIGQPEASNHHAKS